MIAIHHSYAGFNYQCVDVIWPRDELAVPETPEVSPGRDFHVTLKSLLYAVAQIQCLPDHRQEWSDMCDMCELIRRRAGNELAFLVYGVESHVGREINLWPDTDRNTDEDYDCAMMLRADIDQLKRKFVMSAAEIDALPSNVIRFIEPGEDA